MIGSLMTRVRFDVELGAGRRRVLVFAHPAGLALSLTSSVAVPNSVEDEFTSVRLGDTTVTSAVSGRVGSGRVDLDSQAPTSSSPFGIGRGPPRRPGGVHGCC